MTKPRKINVEPLLFLHAFYFGLFATVDTAFITFKFCLWLMDSHEQAVPNEHSYCLKLGSISPSGSIHNISTNNSDDLAYLNRVQIASARFMIIQEIVSTLPTVLATICIGAWSDRHGRKGPMVLGLAGSALAAQIWLVTAAIDHTPVYAVLAGTVISACTGAALVVHGGAYTMITDSVHDHKQLTVRIALAMAVSTAGHVLAQVTAGFVLNKWDEYALVYLCGAVVSVMAFIYSVCWLQETRQFAVKGTVESTVDTAETPTPQQDQSHENNSSVAPVTLIQESISILTKWRPGRRRFYLLITVASLTVLFISDPSGVLNLLAKRPPLSLTNSDYSFLTATGSAFRISPALITWLLKPSDMCLMLAGIAFGVAQMTVTALSYQKWMLFTAMALGGLSHLNFAGYRAFTTKLVEPNETGRLFAMVGILSNVSPLIASAIFNNLYAVTLHWFPGFVFLLAAIFAFLVLIVISYVYVDIRRHRDDREELINDEINE